MTPSGSAAGTPARARRGRAGRDGVGASAPVSPVTTPARLRRRRPGVAGAAGAAPASTAARASATLWAPDGGSASARSDSVGAVSGSGVAATRARLRGRVAGVAAPSAAWEVVDSGGPSGASVIGPGGAAPPASVICMVAGVAASRRRGRRGVEAVVACSTPPFSLAAVPWPVRPSWEATSGSAAAATPLVMDAPSVKVLAAGRRRGRRVAPAGGGASACAVDASVCTAASVDESLTSPPIRPIVTAVCGRAWVCDRACACATRHWGLSLPSPLPVRTGGTLAGNRLPPDGSPRCTTSPAGNRLS